MIDILFFYAQSTTEKTSGRRGKRMLVNNGGEYEKLVYLFVHIKGEDIFIEGKNPCVES